MLSNLVSIVLRMSEILLTTSLNSSIFDTNKLMLSVPIITLLTFLTVIFLRFEILLASFIRTDFHYLRNKISGHIIFFPVTPYIIRLFSFIWLLI